MKKTWSCGSLHYGVFAAPDVLRHCCKRFYVNGEMRGDVEICEVTSNEDISYESIREQKKRLYEDINSGKPTACMGCPWLSKEEWPSLDQLEIRRVSIEHHSVCNLRCSYCSDTYFGGKQAKYDIELLMDNLSRNNAISDDFSLVWGGGESVLLNSFDRIFPRLIERYKPSSNHLFTNATVYNPVLGDALRKGQVTVTTSVDAGTAETYKQIKAKDKFSTVMENLVRYSDDGGDSLTIKYILMPENSSKEELVAFIEEIENRDLAKCSFQISSDFTDEKIGDAIVEAAMFLLKNLKRIGAEIINFDYHLRPRLDKFRSESKAAGKTSKTAFESVIVWGAGEYATRMLEDRSILRKVGFFVDSDPRKQGKEVDGIAVRAPSTILEEKDPVVFIASIESYRDIYREILRMGVPADRILDANNF